MNEVRSGWKAKGQAALKMHTQSENSLRRSHKLRTPGTRTPGHGTPGSRLHEQPGDGSAASDKTGGEGAGAGAVVMSELNWGCCRQML